MKSVRDRGDAEWLPSRSLFALFRLASFVRMSFARPEIRPGVILILQPAQNAVEVLTASAYVLLVTSVHAGAALALLLPVWLATLLAVPVGILALQVPSYILGFALAWPFGRVFKPNHRMNGVVSMTILLIVSFLALEGPVAPRYAGLSFLILATANAVAAVIMWVLRGQVARLESALESSS